MLGSNRRILQFSNVGSTVITLIVNALSNTSILGGKNVGEISDSYPTLFTPAGYVFSIWGVIYTLLLVFTVYQFLPQQKDKSFIGRVSGLYVLAGLANSVWIVLWTNEYVVQSTVMIFVLLGSLVAIYLRLDIGKDKTSLREKIAVHLPFSVYLGWITVATIANVAVSLTAINWDGWKISDVSWTSLMIGLTLIVTLIVILKRRDIGYSLIIVWALVGIIIKQIGIQTIVLVSGVGLGIILSVLIIQTIRVLRFS